MAALTRIDAENAQAREVNDRDAIFAAIKNGIGFERLNGRVKAHLRSWLAATVSGEAQGAEAALGGIGGGGGCDGEDGGAQESRRAELILARLEENAAKMLREIGSTELGLSLRRALARQSRLHGPGSEAEAQ